MLNRFVRIAAAAMLLAMGAQAAIFGSAYLGPNGPASLYKISPDNGAATLVGPIGFKRVSALDFAPNGTLYGIGTDAGGAVVLLTIDTTTGAGSLVGPTGVAETFQDIAFRPSDGVLFGYSGQTNPIMGRIYTINTTTGAATLVGSNPTFPAGNGLAFSSGNVLYTSSFGFPTTIVQTVNQATGVVGAPTILSVSGWLGYIGAPNGMKFDGNGTLWASVYNGVFNSLGVVDLASNRLIFVGQTVNGLDAIAIKGPTGPAPVEDLFDLYYLWFFLA